MRAFLTRLAVKRVGEIRHWSSDQCQETTLADAAVDLNSVSYSTAASSSSMSTCAPPVGVIGRRPTRGTRDFFERSEDAKRPKAGRLATSASSKFLILKGLD